MENKSSDSVRAFIAIEVPDNVKKEVQKIQFKLPSFKGKLTESENLHLTLKFLGEIDREMLIEIKRRLKEIKFKEFEAVVDKIGVFDNTKSRKYSRKIIVWLHLTNCNALQKIVDEKLASLFSKEKRFMSHLTIARIKGLKNKNYFASELKKIKIPRLKFKVDEFNLMKSVLYPEGPIYKVLEDFSLDSE